MKTKSGESPALSRNGQATTVRWTSPVDLQDVNRIALEDRGGFRSAVRRAIASSSINQEER